MRNLPLINEKLPKELIIKPIPIFHEGRFLYMGCPECGRKLDEFRINGELKGYLCKHI